MDDTLYKNLSNNKKYHEKEMLKKNILYKGKCLTEMELQLGLMNDRIDVLEKEIDNLHEIIELQTKQFTQLTEIMEHLRNK